MGREEGDDEYSNNADDDGNGEGNGDANDKGDNDENDEDKDEYERVGGREGLFLFYCSCITAFRYFTDDEGIFGGQFRRYVKILVLS